MGSLKVPVLLAGTTDDPLTAVRPAGRLTYDPVRNLLQLHDGIRPGGQAITSQYPTPAGIQRTIIDKLARALGRDPFDNGTRDTDAVTDDADRLQAMLDACAGGVCLLPHQAVAYAVGRSLLPRDNTTIRFFGAPEFVPTGALKSRTDMRGFFDPSGTTGVKFEAIGGEAVFRAAPFNAALAAQPVDSRLYAVFAGNAGGNKVTGMTVRDVRGRGVQHVYVTTDQTYANIVTPATNPTGHNCNTKIRIIRGGADNDTAATGDCACSVRYGFDWSVLGSTYTNVAHGVNWWGGDADLTRDGALANERKCGSFEIRNVVVIGSPAGGGIWGSMGRDFRIVTSTTKRCGDVGIDPEGCINGTIEACRAEDCGYATGGANYTVFSSATGIAFINCVSISSQPGALLFQTFTGQSPLGGDITIQGGYWACNAASGSAPGFIKASSANRDITITGIKGMNVCIALDGNNNNQITVANNNLDYDRAFTKAIVAILASRVHGYSDSRGATAGTVIITENKIKSRATQIAGSIPIQVYADDFNYSTDVEISANQTRGWAGTDILLQARGTNAGQKAIFNVFGNVLCDGGNAGAGTIANDNTGAAAAATMNRGANRHYRTGASLDPAAAAA